MEITSKIERLKVLRKRYEELSIDLLRNSDELGRKQEVFELENAFLKGRVREIQSEQAEVKQEIINLAMLLGTSKNYDNDNNSS